MKTIHTTLLLNMDSARRVRGGSRRGLPGGGLQGMSCSAPLFAGALR